MKPWFDFCHYHRLFFSNFVPELHFVYANFINRNYLFLYEAPFVNKLFGAFEHVFSMVYANYMFTTESVALNIFVVYIPGKLCFRYVFPWFVNHYNELAPKTILFTNNGREELPIFMVYIP